MTTQQRIVIIIDNMEHAKRSIARAIELAHADRTEIILIGTDPQHGKRHIERLRRDIGNQGLTNRGYVLDNPSDDELARWISTEQADIIIVPQEDKGRLERLLMGDKTKTIEHQTAANIIRIPV
ncbi:MAG: universal stress protein [Anaerolineales bacterium]